MKAPRTAERWNKMPLRKLAHPVYLFGHRTARMLGIIRPLRRLFGPAIGRWVFRSSSNNALPLEVDGHQMVLATEGKYPPLNMALDRYEPATTRLMKGLLGPDMTVVDIGAHVGYYSLLAASRVGPTGTVYSFEPEPGNYGLLVHNLDLNGYKNVVTVNKALSSRPGPVPFFLTSLDSGRHSVYSHGLPDGGRIEVEAATLDEFFQTEGWPSIDLVKIDVEGAELDVLHGMEESLRRWEGVRLIVELNPSLLRDAEAEPVRLFDMLTTLGFHAWCIEDEGGFEALEPAGFGLLDKRLSADQTSVNLLFSRRWEEFAF